MCVYLCVCVCVCTRAYMLVQKAGKEKKILDMTYIQGMNMDQELWKYSQSQSFTACKDCCPSEVKNRCKVTKIYCQKYDSNI